MSRVRTLLLQGSSNPTQRPDSRDETIEPGRWPRQRPLSTTLLGDPFTEVFDRWFGDSRVVDGEGRPKVVYHGHRGGIQRLLARWAPTSRHPSRKARVLLYGIRRGSRPDFWHSVTQIKPPSRGDESVHPRREPNPSPARCPREHQGNWQSIEEMNGGGAAVGVTRTVNDAGFSVPSSHPNASPR